MFTEVIERLQAQKTRIDQLSKDIQKHSDNLNELGDKVRDFRDKLERQELSHDTTQPGAVAGK